MPVKGGQGEVTHLYTTAEQLERSAKEQANPLNFLLPVEGLQLTRFPDCVSPGHLIKQTVHEVRADGAIFQTLQLYVQ